MTFASQPRFDEASKVFHKLGNVNCNPDHGSFPVAEYECLWPRVSCVKTKVGFETNVNTSLFKDSLKNLGDPTVVREHNKFLSAEARGA